MHGIVFSYISGNAPEQYVETLRPLRTVRDFGGCVLNHRCLILRFGGAILFQEWKEALWEKRTFRGFVPVRSPC